MKRVAINPHSALVILKSTLPLLLVDVDSTPTEGWTHELIWMLLGSATIVRFANNFLGVFETKKDIFTHMASVRKAGKGKATRLAENKMDT